MSTSSDGAFCHILAVGAFQFKLNHPLWLFYVCPCTLWWLYTDGSLSEVCTL